jgi:hypothetical protein
MQNEKFTMSKTSEFFRDRDSLRDFVRRTFGLTFSGILIDPDSSRLYSAKRFYTGDVELIDVAQPIWLRGCLTLAQKQAKNAFLCF